MNKSLLALSIATTMLLCGSASHAADVVPVNFDDPGEGYNDTTPALPAGGNPGTTIGEQRRIVAQFAADLWGSVLVSDQPVFVGAQFNPLGPNVLGSAGATFVFSDFAPGIVADTWYSSALADAISGTDLQPGFIDINSQFSSDFDFYYGLDGDTPAGQVSFLDVVMHEFGHGLGFQNFENEAAGTFLANRQDIYSVFTFDNTTGKYWTQMTVPERQASALNYGKVVFDGVRATLGAGLTLDPRTAFTVTAPAALAGEYEYGTASFGPAITPANFSGTVVLGADGVGANNDGCEPLANPAAVAGNIVLLDRGGCTFVIKALNAQAAGATGMVIADNVAGTPPPALGGTDPAITIPAIRITLADGNAFKANLPAQVGLVVDPDKLQGADDAGHPRLFMPDPVQGGSSGSHYDTALAPNALMEPAINDSLDASLNLDISANLLQDTGWTINGGNARIGNCDTGVDVVDDAGIIVGANVQATSNLCESRARNRGHYQRCMAQYADRLEASGLVSGPQADAITSCAAKSGKGG
ncbi:PA domain-containing protein [Luteimonas sp. 22616]|uniref:PA domain-containing protein n=1 Tax=Luteimonas sp. 22616 TaxID=3453951 RepID=UPI003F84F96F